MAGALVVIITFSISADVTLRYGIGQPITWVFEATEYSLLYITFLGTAWLLKKDGHVKLDIVLNMLKPKAQAILNVITSILLILVCFALTWYGTETTIDHFVRGVTSIKYYEPPIFIFLIIIPIAGFLLLIQSIKRTYGYIQQINNTESHG